MPDENGEKQLEKLENPREEDRGDDTLERCLKEFQDTLNLPEEVVQRESAEESIDLTDGLGGRVTEAQETETKSPGDEKPQPLIVGGELTTNHENQEAMSKPTTNNREATEELNKDEYKKDADKKSQSTDEEIRLPKYGDGDLNQAEERGGLKAKIDRNATRELQQTLEQQQGKPEHNKRSETLSNERPQGDQDKESEARTKEDTKHQEEEHACFKLSDNPKAFIDANRELLVKEGISLENNEAKLDGKTTLRLNEKEGLTIDHGDQHYKITTVEQGKIGDTELNKYKTNQGEEFLHIPKENKLAPPYETPWYALPRTTTLYLDNTYQRELLRNAVDQAGGVKALQQELEKRETHTHKDSLYDYLSGRANGMWAEKLTPILRYLGRDLNEPNSHITAIGLGKAIENPKLPFRLDNLDGSRLIAARLSDGTLTTPKGRGPRFSYRNKDEEQRNRVAESLTNVFGEVNTKYIHYTDHGWEKSVLTTLPEIIGHALQRAGAITGEVVKQNPDIPTFIQQGTKEMKREWLKQAFGDEGTIHPGSATPEMSRAVDITHRLSNEQRKQLDTQSEGWKKITYPEGTEQKYCRLHEIPSDVKEAFNLHPRLLDSEARMLREEFGLDPKISPGKIYPREGGYGLMCVLSITKEDTRTFYNEVGFPQQRKQEKLANMLKNEGGR